MKYTLMDLAELINCIMVYLFQIYLEGWVMMKLPYLETVYL